MSWGLVKRVGLVSRHTCLQSEAGVALYNAARETVKLVLWLKTTSCAWSNRPKVLTDGVRQSLRCHFVLLTSQPIRS